MPPIKLQKWIVFGTWSVFLPIMTLASGPFRPILFKNHQVNLIWDPIYSFGWTFVHNGARHNDTNPSPMALFALIFMVLTFFAIVSIGHMIGKSQIKPYFKWICFCIVVGSFFINLPIKEAMNIHHLHFLLPEIS